MPTAIYVRVSTEDQAKHGYSIPDQIRQCRTKAGETDIWEYVDEGVSGEFLDRPALLRLRQDVRDGLIDTVVCYDPDRLSRKLAHSLLVAEEIEKRSRLVFVNGEFAKTPEGMLFYQMRGAVAEFEKAKITERMASGRRQKARQGKVVRDFQIYGYRYDKETAQLRVHEEEAAVVRLIFDLFTKPGAAAQGINGIANHLTRQGIPTKKHVGVWHRQVVRQILHNPAYIGELYQNRWNAEGMLGNPFRNEDEKIHLKARPRSEWIGTPCPAIVEEAQWRYAQQLLTTSRRRWAGESRHEYLLSGLVRCADCGNTMTGRRAKNWGRFVYEYTCVKNTAGAKHKGCGHRLICEDLDGQIWQQMQAWLTVPEELAAAISEEPVQAPYEQDEWERVCRDIERNERGQQRLLALVTEEDGLDLGDIRDKLKELKAHRAQWEARKVELETILAAQAQRDGSRQTVQEAVEHYLAVHPEELTEGQRREILRMVVREIRVYKDGRVDVFTF